MAYTVQFDDGTEVDFDTEPSQADIDEVASSLKLQPAAQEESPKSLFGNLGTGLLDVVKGPLKGVASTVAGGLDLAEQASNVALKAIGKQPVKTTSFQQADFVPTSPIQRIGFGAEQVAEFLVPVGPGIKAVAGGGKLARLGKASLRAGAGTADALVRSTIQEGELPGKADALAQAELAAGFEVLAGTLPFAGKVGAAILGKTTGTSGPVIKEAFENPDVRKYAARASKEGGVGLLREALNDAKRGFARLSADRGAKYVKQLEKIKSRPEKLREIKENAVLRGQEALEDASVKLQKGKLSIGAFRNSAIEQGRSATQKAYRTLRTWNDLSAAGLDRLKKKLNQFKNSVRNTTDGSYAVIKSMSESVDDGLKTYVPGYQKMTADYRAASETLDEIDRALSPGNPNVDTAVRKLLLTLRENNEIRKGFLEQIEKKAGRDITGKLAGQELSALAPKGLAGRIAAGGIPFSASAVVANPAIWPPVLLYIASLSPRLVGEATSLLGSLYRGIPRETVSRGLQGILNQAESESP